MRLELKTEALKGLLMFAAAEGLCFIWPQNVIFKICRQMANPTNEKT